MKGPFNTNVHLPRVSVAAEDSYARIQKVFVRGGPTSTTCFLLLF